MQPSLSPRRGFTLIEILLVISIAAMIMTIGVPAFLRTIKKGPMSQAVSDIIEACSHARAQAILSGAPVELRILPKQRQFIVASAAARPAAETSMEATLARHTEPETGPARNAAFSAQLSEEIILEMVDVNLHEYKDAAEVQVRFYPNGTSEELTVVLQWNREDWRKISLDMVTGMAEMEVIK